MEKTSTKLQAPASPLCVTEPQRQQAIRAGWTAAGQGLQETHCPYAETDSRRSVWLTSYRAAVALAVPDQALDALRERISSLVARPIGESEGAPKSEFDWNAAHTDPDWP
ncbi:MAG TPA: Rmf/CrpP family protein [Chloroflexota bacterium]|nr:Rmf/CrpP family protein [Chloroflexota bacterium]